MIKIIVFTNNKTKYNLSVFGGSTACIALMINDKIIISNIGDSRLDIYFKEKKKKNFIKILNSELI